MDGFRGPVLILNGTDLAVAGLDFTGGRVAVNGDIGLLLGLVHQHLVRFQLGHEFKHGDGFDDAGQIQCRFNTGVTAADYRHVLALEEGTVAVRAVSHTITDVLFLAGHTQLTPFGTGGHDHGLGVDFLAGGQHHGLDLAVAHLGHFQVFLHGHIVVVHVGVQGTGQFRAGGFLHRDQVLDIHGVFHLAANTVGNQGDFQALAGTVDGRRHAGGAAADHGHVLQRQFFPGACLGDGRIKRQQFVDQLGGGDLAIGEQLAIQVHAGNTLDVPGLHGVLEQAAVDHFSLDARIEQGELIERLHHVRTVVTAQADEHLEMQVVFHVGDHALQAVIQLDVGT